MQNFAVIFDMDGVIIDSNPFHKVALKEFVKKYGHDLNERELREKIYGRTNKEWIRNIFGEISPEKLHQYAQEKEALFRQLYENDIQALQGIQEFIEALESHKIPKAIGTSAPFENVEFVLQKTQLTKYFQTILDESHVDKGKPNPEIYIKVAKALGFPTEKCVVFEDSLSGVQSARDAGCKVVGVMTTHDEDELNQTDLQIKDFSGLKINQIAALF